MIVDVIDDALADTEHGKVLLSPPCVAQCGLAWGLPATARTTTARMAAAAASGTGAMTQLLRMEGFSFDEVRQLVAAAAAAAAAWLHATK